MRSPCLRAEGLRVRLGRREVLAGIDVDIGPGALTIVVGPNGAGKTTLLRALAGLVVPASGTIRIGDRPLDTFSAAERARTIAYLPQGGTIAWPISVQNVVALGRLPHGEHSVALPDVGRRAVAAAIQAVGLNGFEARAATELSGGERTRVLLARALATEAPILLADEPVAALDPRHQLLVMDVLKARVRNGDCIIAVMHDLALAARFADRMLLMQEGRLVADGTPRDVLTLPHLAASFGIEATVGEDEGRLTITPLRPII